MSIRAVVFDLDGTLLHTMPDLAASANDALSQMGFPTLAEDEMLAHMGLGGRELFERIVPTGTTQEQRKRVFELWRTLYIASPYALTEPFPGIEEALHALKSHGVKTAVLSNKFDEGTRALTNRHFPALFDVVRGDVPPAPRKPDPTSLLATIRELGVEPDEAVYVGDSIVDVLTARNAGVACIGVSWGYDSIASLPVDELHAYVGTPAELVRLCTGTSGEQPGAGVSIRQAQPGDEALILDFIRELAEYEHSVNEVVATEELLRVELFEKGYAEVLFIEEGTREVGFALFFHNFSTWLGRSGIYLEDLFVKPAYRGRGYGKALLSKLAQLAVERDCGRVEWACLDWNKPSIDFYLSLGATPMNEWTTYRLEGDAITSLAHAGAPCSPAQPSRS